MPNPTKPHPTLLAFGYTYLPQGGDEYSYAIINAVNRAAYNDATRHLSSAVLLDVSFVSAEDGFTVTDLIWRLEMNKGPYTDVWANNARVFDEMDRIKEGGA